MVLVWTLRSNSSQGHSQFEVKVILESNGNVVHDKIWMYEEMMKSDDNVESRLLTYGLLKIHILYKFCYKLHISSWRSRWTELCSSCIYEVFCTSLECVGDLPLFILLEV